MTEELNNREDEVEERFDDDYAGEEFDEENAPAADEDYEEEEADVSYVDGPAVFARTREGRRRNVRAMVREVNFEDIDYKRVQILSRFVDRHGRILSRRKTRISAKMQRRVTQEIKRARHLALMPYTLEHGRITRRRS